VIGWHSNHKASAEEFMPHWDVRCGVRHVVGTALKIMAVVPYLCNKSMYVIFTVLIEMMPTN
jgi:hypothetical protein